MKTLSGKRRVFTATPAERIHNVTRVCLDLLNALKIRRYRITEKGNRIVFESEPLHADSPITPPVHRSIDACTQPKTPTNNTK